MTKKAPKNTIAMILDAFDSIGLLRPEPGWFDATWYRMEVAFDLLKVASHVILDMRERRATTSDDAIRLLNDMRTLSGGLFDFDEVVPHAHDLAHFRLWLTFTANQRSYKALLFVLEDAHRIMRFGPDSLIRTANQVLMDAGRAERFHLVAIVGQQGGGAVKGSAIIFLTPTQRRVILEKELLSLPWVELEINPWSSDKAQAFITDLQHLGLLETLTEEQLAQLHQQLRFDDVATAHGAISRLPGLVYTFDIECLYEPVEPVLMELIKDISALSRGVIKPEQVAVNVEESEESDELRTILVSFEVEGQPYRCQLEDWGDFVDARFIALLNQALAASGKEGRFYSIADKSQYLSVLFLSPHQHAELQKRAWFELEGFDNET